MIRSTLYRALILIVILTAAASALAQEEEKAWPRVIEAENATVTMYQPQLDSWADNDFQARAAVSVQEGEAPPIFGAVWISGRFDVDLETRWVDFDEITIPSVAFPEATEEHQQQLADFLEREIPKWGMGMELDRVIPLLDNAEVAVREDVGALRCEAPPVHGRTEVAIQIDDLVGGAGA